MGGHGAHSGATSGRRAATGGGGHRSLDAVPSDQFCEQSLFLVYKLFDFVLDGIGIDIGRFGEELRAGYVVTFKTRRRRYCTRTHTVYLLMFT